MTVTRLVVVGASAGGIDALRKVVGTLPADFPAPICIVLHRSTGLPRLVEEVLSRAGALPVVTAETGARLRPGHLYVAPPDRHIIVEPGVLRTTRDGGRYRFGPAIDPLFQSAAAVYGPAAIGVILSGNLDDGISGLWAIKHLGGTTIVQDPADAQFPSMPRAALDHVDPDFVVPVADIGPLLVRLATQPADQPVKLPHRRARGAP